MTKPASNFGNLLVIDDEPEIVKSLFRQFRTHYKVLRAESADMGYQIMCKHPVNVIISDQRMPGTTGAEFYEKVKVEFPDAMRLLLTGYADVEAVIKAIHDGNIFRYIVKPWDPVELDTIVREAMAKYDLIVENRRLVSDLQLLNASLETRVEQRTEELHLAIQTLEALNQQKNRFLGVAAHDLRNPLSAIINVAEMLIDAPSMECEERHELLRVALRSAEGMLNLVNTSLDVSAIEEGQLRLRRQQVEVNDYASRVAAMNNRLAAQRGLGVELDLHEAPSTANFDPDRVEQVLNNLLGNAIKFSDSGRIILRAVGRDDGGITFTVSDKGPGIAGDVLPRIFGGYEQGSGERAAKGVGLGLAICRKIVEQHAGDISVHSRLGQGAEFTVSLPPPAY